MSEAGVRRVYVRFQNGVLFEVAPIPPSEMEVLLSDRQKREIIGVPVFFCELVPGDPVILWPNPSAGIEVVM